MGTYVIHMPWGHTAAFAPLPGGGKFAGVHFRKGELVFANSQQCVSVRNFVVDGSAAYDSAKEKKAVRMTSAGQLIDVVDTCGSSTLAVGRVASFVSLHDLKEAGFVSEKKWPRETDCACTGLDPPLPKARPLRKHSHHCAPRVPQFHS